ERILERPPGRRAARAVAVETEGQLVADPEDAHEVIGGRGRAERRDGASDSGLMQAHDIHVAFNDQQPIQGSRALPGLVEAVKLPALVKELGFRRVQVLRLAFVEHASPKAERAAARITDGEHHTVAKPVVVSGGDVGFALPLDEQAGLQEARALRFTCPELPQQGVPGVGRIAQREAGRRLARQAARFEVFAGARGALQLMAIELRRLFERLEQPLRARWPRRLLVFAWNLHPQTSSEILDRLDEAEVIVLHEEPERRAVSAAAEA